MKPSETYHIIQAMKATGNRAGVIEQWKNDVEIWATWGRTIRDPNAEAVLSWLPLWQPRCGYTAEELAPLWPALAIVTGFTSCWPAVVKSARRLAHELDFYGLPFRLLRGQKYYIVERIHYWREAPTDELEREIFGD